MQLYNFKTVEPVRIGMKPAGIKRVTRKAAEYIYETGHAMSVDLFTSMR